MKYHVVVTGSRPDKGMVDGKERYLPIPEANSAFIFEVLDRIPRDNYVALYHGMAEGVDSVADAYAFERRIRVRQFPADWSPKKQGERYDATAGHKRNEFMIRTALKNAYGKNDEQVVVVAFTNKPLVDSKGTNACVTYAKSKNVAHVQHFILPVTSDNLVTTEGQPF